MTPQTNSSSVAARYGNYALNVNAPDRAIVMVAACPSGGANCWINAAGAQHSPSAPPR